jgi:hypothetical protein
VPGLVEVGQIREVPMRYLVPFMCVCALGIVPLVGCGETVGTGGNGGTGGEGGMAGIAGTGGTGGVDVSAYAAEELWLCRPDIENDRCDQADLTFAEIRPDGSKVTGDVVEDPDAEVDCFYVHHTVYFADEPSNREVLVPHPEEVIGAVFRNGAHYRGVCRVFAPMYHQMSLITYTVHWSVWRDTEFFKRAYGDVSDAFDYYMRHYNNGRGIVLIGHSQGSHMLIKLLQDKFADDEELRERLVSAVLMGPTGYVQVPEDELVGGTFTNIPLCTSANETGCVIAFDAAYPETGVLIALGSIPIPPMIRACLNPVTFDGTLGTLAALTYPHTYESLIPFPDGVDTEWVRYPKIFTAQCPGGDVDWCTNGGCSGVLEIQLANDYAGDVPITPKELQDALVEVWETLRGLHGGEYFIANTDLVRIVEQQIASHGN